MLLHLKEEKKKEEEEEEEEVRKKKEKTIKQQNGFGCCSSRVVGCAGPHHRPFQANCGAEVLAYHRDRR